VTLDEAQKHFAELVRGLGREGEVIITNAEKPVAKITSVSTGTTIHPEAKAITGLVPEDKDGGIEYRKHLIEKHR
jgi:prevent-host-death family protein